MNEIVYRGESNQPLTNSKLVAEVFGKPHKVVLVAIRNILEGSAQNCAVLEMFSESTYLNEQNKEQPMFIMNQDGFTLLAMGFNGKKAMEFKLKYIEAFNAMKRQIEQSNPSVTQIAQDYGMSAMRLNKELESMRIQHKVRGQWILFAQFLEGGYVHSRAVDILRSDGGHDVKYNTEWTTKGRIFLYESLKAKGILHLIEQENTPSDKSTSRTEPAKAASASQQTIKFN